MFTFCLSRETRVSSDHPDVASALTSCFQEDSRGMGDLVACVDLGSAEFQ